MEYSTFHPAAKDADDNCALENNAIVRLSELARQHKINQANLTSDNLSFAFENPVSTSEAWSKFGWLLGLIAPAAIFLKLFSYGFTLGSRPSAYGFAALLLSMNFICALAGRAMANGLSSSAAEFARCSWSLMLIFVPLIGLVWGIVTGFAGGLLFFGIGALAGIFFASPIGVLGFTLFAIFHRLMVNHGFIERKHFLPISYGICLVIAAFILGY